MQKVLLRAFLVTSAALAFSSCGEDPANTATPVSKDPIPAFPVWAQPLIGTVALSPVAKDCVGAFDLVMSQHTGSQAGLEVEGWGWIGANKVAPDHIIFTLPNGKIVGAAETNWDRPDVKKAIPTITTSHVGWRGTMNITSGIVNVYALFPDSTTCSLASKDIAPKSAGTE
jgi:hypothetical protein